MPTKSVVVYCLKRAAKVVRESGTEKQRQGNARVATNSHYLTSIAEHCQLGLRLVQDQLAALEDLIRSNKQPITETRPIENRLEAIGKAFEIVEQRVGNPVCRVGLIGEFSTGKSTLINALLQDDILESGAIQGTTTFPIRIRYGKTLAAQLHLRDGTRVPVRGATRDEVLQALRNCAINEQVEPSLSHASLYLPSALLCEGIEIIDAPGIDSVSPRHLKITVDAMRRFCDSFVVLIPSTMPATSNLLMFLKEHLVDNLHRCLFIVTKTDLLRSERDVSSVIENATARIMSELGLTYQPTVLGCAAEIELCTTLGLDPNTERSRPLSPEKIERFVRGFSSVRDAIQQFASDQFEIAVSSLAAKQFCLLADCFDECVWAPLEVIGYRDEMHMWKSSQILEDRTHTELVAIEKVCRSLADASVMEWELDVKRDFGSLQERLKSELSSKSDYKSAALYVRNTPRSELRKACSESQASFQQRWSKVATAISNEFAEIQSSILSEFESFMFVSQPAVVTGLDVKLTDIADLETKDLANTNTDDNTTGAQIGGAVVGAGLGAAILGPAGLWVGGFLGSKAGELFGGGAETFKTDMKAKLSSCVQSVQRQAVAKAKREFERGVSSQIEAIRKSIDESVAQYKRERRKLELLRPDTSAFSALAANGRDEVDEVLLTLVKK